VRQDRRGELADGDPGMHLVDAHMAKKRVDLHLDDLHRAWNARADGDVRKPPHHPAEDAADRSGVRERRADVA
jgi:hypothetical protein